MDLQSNSPYSRRQSISGLTSAEAAIWAISSSTSLGPGAVPKQKNESAKGWAVPKQVGIALVGLGTYSTEQLAPALQQTRYCKLTGIVTGSPEKIGLWKRQYNIADDCVYNYENFDTLKDNAKIDIVYVVLPNALHAEYTIRAAKAGKHVICEKPMAISVQECEAMIAACKAANRTLSIGYRLHVEPYNLAMMEMGRKGTFGKIKKVQVKHGMEIKSGGWRLSKELAGGGPLMDVGIYGVQGALYTLGKDPVAVTAQEGKKTDEKKFNAVEQSLTWQLEFEDNVIAAGETSYAEEMNLLRAEAEHGWFELSPAYAYTGIKGKTSQGDLNFPEVNQQVLQMDDIARCVIEDKPSKIPGEMGLRDMKILTAIYHAAATGEKVNLNL